MNKLFAVFRAVNLATLALLSACGGGSGGNQGFSISPSNVTLTTWDKQQFTASTPAYWDVQESGGGFFDGANGVYTASYLPGVYHVRARRQSNVNETATATVKVVDPPDASMTCPLIVNHGTQGIQATVPVQAGVTYAWTVEGTSIVSGQSTHRVTFDAPASGSLAVTCTVKNEAGKTASQTTNITVASAPTISSFSASPGSILGGQTTTLTAAYSGFRAQVDGVGTIQNGVELSVVPPCSTSYTLRVYNQAGEEVVRQCVVQVTPVVTAADPTPVVVKGGILPLTAVALGSLDQGISWEQQETGTGGILSNAGSSWSYQAPPIAGVYHLIARSTASPTAQTTITVTVFEPYSSFQVGGYPTSPYSDLAVQPAGFGWAGQSRFKGPRAIGGLQTLRTIQGGSDNCPILLGPRGEFYTPFGKKWDAYGRPLPAFQPTNTNDLTAPLAIDKKGRVLVFDYVSSARLCALNADTGALEWATPVPEGGGNEVVSSRLTLGPDGRMARYLNWNGNTGGTVMVLSAEGAMLWNKAIADPRELVFCPDGGLVCITGQRIIKVDADGNEVWRLAEPYGFGLPSMYNGIHPRAVVDTDGTLYTSYGDAANGAPDSFGLIAVSADGRVLWQTAFTNGRDPYLSLAQDGTILCTLQGAQTPVIALDAKDGRIKWEYKVASGTASCAEALVDRDGYVYVAPRTPYRSTMYEPFTGDLLALTPAGDLLWKMNLSLGYSGSPTPRLTLGPRHELYVTWDETTWVLTDPPQP